MRRSLLAFALLVAFGAAEANAQATVGTTIRFSHAERLYINVDNNDLTLPTPTIADLDAGFSQSVSHNVEHRGNVDHTITVANDQANWNAPLTYVGSKPANELEWSNDGGTSWNAVTAAVDVGSGVQGGFGLNPDIPVSWRAVVAYDEPDGDYSLPVTYTSTAN